MPISVSAQNAAAPQQLPPGLSAQAADTLLVDLRQTGTSFVQLIRMISIQEDDAQAATLLDQLTKEMQVAMQRIGPRTAKLTIEQRRWLEQQMQQQPWVRELADLSRGGTLLALERRAQHHAALGAALQRFQAVGILGKTRHYAAPADPLAE